MTRRLVALVCLLLLCVQVAWAEEDVAVVPGEFVAQAEQAVLESGMELRTEASVVWGGLPLLDEATDRALGSLLDSLAVTARRQQAEGSGYQALDILLQDVSVVDIAMQTIDGVYYEQSNITGGQVLSFTPEEFRTFAARLSAQSEGAIPPNLDGLYQFMMRLITGDDEVQVDFETLDGAMMALNDWTADALTETDRLRPKMSIPGLYGLRATVVDVTREEAIALAEAYAGLLAENEALLQSAVAAQMPEEADETRLTETTQYVAALLRELPAELAAALPEDLQAAEYRMIYGPDDQLVANQLEVYLPADIHLFVEWVPEAAGVPSFYVTFTALDLSLELLVTREVGNGETDGKATKQRNRTIAQMTYADNAMQLDVVMTSTENIESREDKETIDTKVDWMMESAEVFGEGAVITLTSERTQTAAGEGKDYVCKAETVWRLKGLGFDGQDIMTIKEETTAQAAASPVNLDLGVVQPAQLDDEAFDTWLKDTQVSLMQAGFTVLGRLPADVAAYILTMNK